MNKAKLEYEMKVKGMSVEGICQALGISRSAWYRKLSGASDFTLKEVQRIVSVLNLESPVEIFLPVKCPKRHKEKRE